VELMGERYVLIASVDGNSPLSGLVKRGEVLCRVNGQGFNDHYEASEILRAANREVVLELCKRPTLFQRLMGSNPAGTGPRAGGVTITKPRNGGHSSPDVRDGNPESPLRAANGSPRATKRVVVEEPPPEPEIADDEYDDVWPTAGETRSPRSPMTMIPATNPDIYSVRIELAWLVSGPSVGLRLMQRKPLELPFVADIDPEGPAYGLDIAVGDTLVAINGIDARAGTAALQRAIRAESDHAIVTLRRVLPAARHPKLDDSLAEPAQSSWWSFLIPFEMCCSKKREASSDRFQVERQPVARDL